MISRVSQTITFLGFFTESKIGKTGLTVTVDVFRVSDGTQLVTGGSATAVGGGLYKYSLSSGSTGTASEYVCIFKTATSTVDFQHVPSAWTTAPDWVAYVDAAITSRLASGSYSAPPSAASIADQVWDETATDHVTAGSMGALEARLDATVSSRLASGSYTAPPSAATVADAVWDEPLSGHATAGSAGAALSAAGSAADPLTNSVPGSYASGTAGAALGRIGSASVVTTSLVAQDGTTEIVRGDSFYAADTTALDYTEDSNSGSWPVLTGASVTLTVKDDDGEVVLTKSGSVVTATGSSKKVRFELSSSDTDITPGVYDFDVQATLSNSHVRTLVLGTFTVKKDVTT